LDTPTGLKRGLGAEQRVVFTPTLPLDPAAVRALPHVTRVERQGEQWIVYGTGDEVVAVVVTHLCAHHIKFRELRTEQPNLEDVFLALTGHEMRD
jgi:ABC-2 type transport system ATP-binding protein